MLMLRDMSIVHLIRSRLWWYLAMVSIRGIVILFVLLLRRQRRHGDSHIDADQVSHVFDINLPPLAPDYLTRPSR